MRIFTQIEKLADLEGGVHLAIGFFDGLHIGHQAVVSQAMSFAESEGQSVLLTFEPHPIRVLQPDKAPKLLTSIDQKKAILEAIGVDALLVLEFDAEYASTSAGAFVESLIAAANPLRSISVGSNWAFGKGREGNVELLQKMGKELDPGFKVCPVAPVLSGGEVVSSTRVRLAVSEGRLADAKVLLGRSFQACGTVKQGKQQGREIGFPTANLELENEQMPPHGVYAVRASVSGGELMDGVANFGTRPTTDGDALVEHFEVHLFELQSEIYGQRILVDFHKFIRPEQRFDAIEELVNQIELDAKSARKILKIV